MQIFSAKVVPTPIYTTDAMPLATQNTHVHEIHIWPRTPGLLPLTCLSSAHLAVACIA